MNVCACFRIKSNLSLGRGSFLRMCSMKSCGVTAARFHFNFPNTTSSHSCRGGQGGEKRSHEQDWKKPTLLISLSVIISLLNCFRSNIFFCMPLLLWSCWLYSFSSPHPLFFFKHWKCQALLKIMRPGSSCQDFTFFVSSVECPPRKFSLQLVIA